MNGATIDAFLRASTSDRLRMARDDAYATVLKNHLGEAAYNEYRALAKRLDTEHLGSQFVTPNLVFVPGVMGSLLTSQTKGGVWWVDLRNLNHINNLGLARNGEKDADPANRVKAFASDMSYEPFLTKVLSCKDFGHEVFAYDWRKPLQASAKELRDVVLRMSTENGGEAVHLVGHSMGGLVIRVTLMEYGEDLWPKLGRIVYIATPHYGATAIAGYLKNHLWGFEMLALLGLYLSRDTFRSLWGVLSLLPAPRGEYPGTRPECANPWKSENPHDAYVHPCADFDLYQADAWKLELSAEQLSALQMILDGAAALHRRLRAWHEGLDQERRNSMLVIAGVGYKTLFRLANQSGFFGLWERMEKVTDRIPADPHREGDGRVPLASSALENVPIRFIKGVHGGLPNIPAVQDDVLSWLSVGRLNRLKLPDSIEQALSQHLAPGDMLSTAPILDDTARSNAASDDPGLWLIDRSDIARITALKADLEAGRLPEFTRIKIL
jgi:pimeloyl-ACP methyl ester carboxylesterase